MVRPADLRDGVVLYAAEDEQGFGDFIAIVLKNRKLEMRYNKETGKQVVDIVGPRRSSTSAFDN